MTLLKTNTNFYKGRIANYIIDRIQAPHKNSPKEKLVQLLHHFDVEHNFANNKKRMPNLQDRLQYYLNCAPFIINLPVYYTDIIADCTKLHKAKALSEQEEVTLCNNYHKHLAYHILKLAEHYKINLTKLY